MAARKKVAPLVVSESVAASGKPTWAPGERRKDFHARHEAWLAAQQAETPNPPREEEQ